MEKNEVVVGISTSAQAEAVRAELPAAAVQRYGLPRELVARALDLGGEVQADGSVRLLEGVRPHRDNAEWAHHHHSDGEWMRDEATTLPRRPADAADALVMIEEVREKRAQEARTRIASFLSWQVSAQDIALARREVPALPEAERADVLARIAAVEAERARELLAQIDRYCAGEPREWGWGVPALDAETIADPAEREAAVDRVRAEDARREAKRERAAEEAERAAQEAARVRLRRLAREVREVNTDEAVSTRLDAATEDQPLGLLPESEALEIVREARLPVDVDGGTLRLRTRIRPDEVCGECAEAGAVKFRRIADADAIGRDVWLAILPVRAALRARGLPEGEVVLHVGECPCEGVAAVESWGISIRLDLGDGLTVQREYECTPSAAEAA